MNSGTNTSLIDVADLKTYRAYFKAITLAFMQNYLVQNENYRNYLDPDYMQYISQQPLMLNLINFLEPN